MLSVTRYGTFGALRAEWDPLVGEVKARGPFLSWQWQNLWWETFATGEDLWLLAVREGATLHGIVPLAADKGRLAFACSAEVSDFLDVIARRDYEEGVVEATVAYLCGEDWRELSLCCMHPQAVAWRLLPERLAAAGFVVTTEQRDVSPVVDLAGDWEAYQCGLSKKDRHELRRKSRRLTDSAQVRMYALRDGEIGPSEIGDFVALHRLSAPEKAVFMDERMASFFGGVFARFARGGYVRLYFMEVDGKRVSAAICFDTGEELLLYNSGYDPAYARLSVGLLLKAYCLQDAIALGRSRFDFLRGAERYKYDLGGKDVPIHGLYVGQRS